MNGLLQNLMAQAMQSKDPRAAKALQLIANGDIQGQKQMAENLCQSIGITSDEAMARIQNEMQGKFSFVNK